ncbi:hypothetical protein [Ruminococcus sp.]|uniref:hypothetical protein n=1 Tax=Ruminococcus sp. TaxID=41978 RepID=UPI0025CD229F|nr:hypothetical protein [Ruminococcus sp.]MCR4638605.1 hypothetical protein [Ruminococcus sp.]
MSENKKIGFDILENSDINTVEEIGTEKMDIDKKARDRMIKITMKKYAEEKKLLGSESNDTHSADEYADSVSGVDNYKQNRITHFIYAALCTAAAVALAAGSIFMLKHNSRTPSPKVSDPIIEATTVTTDTSHTTDKNVTTNTTVSTTSANTAKSSVKTTVNASETSSANGTANSTVKADNASSAITTASNVHELEGSEAAAHANPRTDRKDITQEELDAAAVKAVKAVVSEHNEFVNSNGSQPDPVFDFVVKYAFYDVNEDSVPELFISSSYILAKKYMYVYDGKDYVIARFNGHDMDGREKEHEVILDNIDVFAENHTIGMMGHQGGSQSFILSMGADNSITPLDEYTLYRYYKNGRLTEEYQDSYSMKKFQYFCDEYMSHELRELDWTVYTETNSAE